MADRFLCTPAIKWLWQLQWQTIGDKLHQLLLSSKNPRMIIIISANSSLLNSIIYLYNNVFRAQNPMEATPLLSSSSKLGLALVLRPSFSWVSSVSNTVLYTGPQTHFAATTNSTAIAFSLLHSIRFLIKLFGLQKEED